MTLESRQAGPGFAKTSMPAAPASQSWMGFVADRDGRLISWDHQFNDCSEPLVTKVIQDRDVTHLAPNGLWQEQMSQLERDQRSELQLELGRGDAVRQLPVLLFDGDLAPEIEGKLVNGYVGPAKQERRSETEASSGELDRRLRMEILGELGAGLAHDMRNYLTAASGALDMLQRSQPEGAEAVADDEGGDRWLTAAAGAVQRAAALSAHMIDFGLVAKGEQRCNVASTVSSALSLGRGALKSIDVVEELADDLEAAACDPLLLENVLLNLLINARDAMAPSGRAQLHSGQVKVQAHNVRSLALGLGGSSATVRDFVQVQVSDQGPGIKPELLERIFEPYFSTKHTAGGNCTDAAGTLEAGSSRPRAAGLGLASVRRLVESVGGTVDVSSALGTGTTFIVNVPAAPPLSE